MTRTPQQGLSRGAESAAGDDLDGVRARRRGGVKAGCWVAAIGIVVLLGALLVLLVRAAREAAIASASQCPLNQLQLAMTNYHDAYGCFPPAYVADESGRPVHSWRVLILPFVEEQELYDAYDFREPWDGPNNRRLADRMPSRFHCPSEPASSTYTNYVVIRGPGTAFPGSRSTSFEDFADGPGETILIAEIAASSIEWLEPRDLDVDEMSFSINDESRPSISSSRRKGPYVVFADRITGHWVSQSLSPEALKALTTIAGQEQMYVAEIAGVGLTSPAAGPATDAALKQFDQWEDLHALWLSRSPVTDVGLAELASAPNLDKLFLRGTPITDEGLKSLRGRAYFYTLDLSGTRITDAGLEHLKGLADTYDLHMEDTEVTIGGAARLLKSLPEASIRLSDGLVGHHWLDFEGSPITDADVLHFQGMTVSSVDLSGTKITDASLELLGELPNLQDLDLSRTAISDKGLEHLGRLTSLTSLALADTQITDEGVAHLSGLASLRDLNLARTRITDEGVAHLSGLAGLHDLNLARTRITDSGIEHLMALEEIWWLDLSGTAITDDGVRLLGGRGQLYGLKLNDTRVSDAALEPLEQSTDLYRLEVRGTTVSDEGIRRLQRGLPRLEIVR